MNTFDILALKKLASMVTERIMNVEDKNFYRRLFGLLLQFGASKEELKEILTDLKISSEYNLILEKDMEYVQSRFDLFDEYLGTPTRENLKIDENAS